MIIVEFCDILVQIIDKNPKEEKTLMISILL